MQVTGNKRNTSYILSIRLHADGFSFYSYNASTAGLVAADSYSYRQGTPPAVTLREAIARSKAIPREGVHMVYGLVNSPSMQIPLECFRKEEVSILYRLTYAQKKSGKNYYNILPHLEIAQIFSVDSEVEQALCQAFPGIRFYHSHSMMLEKIWLLRQQASQQTLYAYFDETEIFVFNYKNDKLQYANTFPNDKVDNAVYFLLSAWKGLELDRRQDRCVLLGQHPQKDAAAQSLARFLPNVSTPAATDVFRRSTLARDAQMPFDLLALLVHVI